MHFRWLAIALLTAVLGPLLVVGANQLVDAALRGQVQQTALPADPETSAPEACDPPLPADTEGVLRAITPGGPYDQAVSDRIAALYQADQAVRAAPTGTGGEIAEADRRRRVEVLGYLEASQVQTTRDLVYAAFIFQHGNCPEHYLLANRLAQIAMEAGDPEARWIYAATLDRYLMHQKVPQKYGTQYTVVDGRYELYPVDPATTDEERAQYNVPPLAVAQSRAGAMPVGSHVVRRVLLSWWLTWAGVGYALLGVAAVAWFKKLRLGQVALAAAGLVYLLSIAGHAAEVLLFERAQLPLLVALGIAGTALLVLGTIVAIPSRSAKAGTTLGS
jgi:hypothetical protein